MLSLTLPWPLLEPMVDLRTLSSTELSLRGIERLHDEPLPFHDWSSAYLEGRNGFLGKKSSEKSDFTADWEVVKYTTKFQKPMSGSTRPAA